jgi:hypothetical protein
MPKSEEDGGKDRSNQITPLRPAASQHAKTSAEGDDILDWGSLIFDSYSRGEIQNAVKDEGWQTLRRGLLGAPLETKFRILKDYALTEDRSEAEQEKVRIVVSNYVNALRRGGIVK